MIGRWLTPLLVIAGLLLLGTGNRLRPPPKLLAEELLVTVPLPLQIISAFGDRYLAANIGTWRALMVSVRHLPPDELAALAQIQLSAAWLNPGHEDNYYAATAILPWAGRVDETQEILALASRARPHDIYAPFFHGFNAMYFQGDFIAAGRSAQIAASHADSQSERQILSVIAARWSEKTDDPTMALRIVESMAKETRDPALRKHLQERALRLEGLVQLRSAIQEYRAKYQRPVTDLDQLVSSGILPYLPHDPLGGGYALKNDSPVLLPPND